MEQTDVFVRRCSQLLRRPSLFLVSELIPEPRAKGTNTQVDAASTVLPANRCVLSCVERQSGVASASVLQLIALEPSPDLRVSLVFGPV